MPCHRMTKRVSPLGFFGKHAPSFRTNSLPTTAQPHALTSGITFGGCEKTNLPPATPSAHDRLRRPLRSRAVRAGGLSDLVPSSSVAFGPPNSSSALSAKSAFQLHNHSIRFAICALPRGGNGSLRDGRASVQVLGSRSLSKASERLRPQSRLRERPPHYASVALFVSAAAARSTAHR